MTTPSQAPSGARTKFRKKPIVIEAVQWHRVGDHPSVRAYWTHDPDCRDWGWIETLEGGNIVTPGDWIITGVRGEHYPCKPDIFAATYEPVTAPAPAPAPTEAQPANNSPHADAHVLNECAKKARDWLGGGCDMDAIPRTAIAALATWTQETVREALATPAQAGAQPQIPPGYAFVPDYRGYAHLGTGMYAINISAAGEPAELIISIATEAERADRVIGERRDNPPAHVIQPEQMAVRLRFESAAGLDALEDMLRELRVTHFPSQPPAQGAGS